MIRRASAPRADGVPRKTAEVIAADLRAQILVNGLPPGSPLPSEPELIKKYSFSRSSVREALRLLESEGLIRIKRGPGGGIRVGRPDTSHITRSFAVLFAMEGTPLRELVRFRQLVEPAAAAGAALSASLGQQERLMEATGRLYTGDVSDSDLDFHRVLADCSGNALLRMVLIAVQHLSEWHIPAERLSSDDLEAARTSHRRTALAIVRGDADAAETTMTRHLRAFEQVLDSLGRLDEPIIPASRWPSVAAAAEREASTPT